jgi:hypothetical protein
MRRLLLLSWHIISSNMGNLQNSFDSIEIRPYTMIIGTYLEKVTSVEPGWNLGYALFSGEVRLAFTITTEQAPPKSLQKASLDKVSQVFPHKAIYLMIEFCSNACAIAFSPLPVIRL